MTTSAAATSEQMSAARLPMAYRDSCAHLLIPLNRCRQAEYYLPWKCEVLHQSQMVGRDDLLSLNADRTTHLRKMPVWGIQEESGEDGWVEGTEGKRGRCSCYCGVRNTGRERGVYISRKSSYRMELLADPDNTTLWNIPRHRINTVNVKEMFQFKHRIDNPWSWNLVPAANLTRSSASFLLINIVSRHQWKLNRQNLRSHIPLCDRLLRAVRYK